MANEERLPMPVRADPVAGQAELASQWRRLTRAATVVAVLTSPAVFLWCRQVQHWSIVWSLLATFLLVIAFRGTVDVITRRFIPWPSLFGTEEDALKASDVVNRRRAWYWRKKLRLAVVIVVVVTAAFVARLVTHAPGETVTWWNTATWLWHGTWSTVKTYAGLGLLLPFYFLFNFLILMGPLMLMGISQIKAYEPGDADWDVKLAHVRGQPEAKEEVRRVVTLWQSGEAFESAGGKRERGLLMLGAPGTGKTMLSKAIATSFNCPFVSIPGSGFAQTFIGMDAIIVRHLAWRAKRLARKWGGQCIVFIDEIDAVGQRRSALGNPGQPLQPSIHDLCFYGPMGALNPSGDLILETREWRERLFAERAALERGSPGLLQRAGGIMNQVFPGMFGGQGQLALNQLLVVMDGIGDPPLARRVLTNRVNTFLDACYVIPQRLGKVPLRLARPRPRREQIYFIGACNVPIESLDPALTRPGRMGRHVWFRTPTKDHRKDIFDLYLGKVAHDDDLDDDRRRDELARMTPGYSPAMIEQVCSMALTRAHYEGRPAFSRTDLIEAMTTVESGMAVNIEYAENETRHVAVHEAGHAVAAHVYLKGRESTRLSVRMRGGSLGHHSARDVEERFVHWRHEQMGDLIWGLGAMAAEHVFYGENSTGVGGDVHGVTALAATMVGSWGMTPDRIDLDGRFETPAQEDAARRQIMRRFEAIGTQIMRRSGGGGPFDHDPIAGVLSDRDKRAMAAQLLGQAYVAAYNLVGHNRQAVERIADVLVERREFYGDDVVNLLDGADLKQPEVDLLEEDSWPKV
ncbi:MAG: AAA family ATPase [Gaiellales bacterium]